jgi:DNA-directed RNA polymerase subunit RPC12/RpoP
MTIENYNSLPRVVKCHSVRISSTVDVKKNSDHDRAFYSGLAVCGSVWDCPVCSARILQKRREEIRLAVDWAYKNGFKVVMVTLTTPHYSFQTCKDLLSSFSKALTYLKTGKAWDNYKKTVNWQGSIRGLETLFGSNGWHNHTHELWIVDKSLDSKELETKILSRWFAACDKQNLVPKGKKKAFMDHSVDVVDNASASDYLAKHDDKKNLSWGVDKELTSPLSKASKELLHPFQLAYMSAQGFTKFGDLFFEYSQAFKGKSSVFWSRGLKKKIRLLEKDDEELAKQETEKIDVLISFEHFAWTVIKSEKARALILDIAEKLGADGVEDWLRAHKVSSVPSYFT